MRFTLYPSLLALFLVSGSAIADEPKPAGEAPAAPAATPPGPETAQAALERIAAEARKAGPAGQAKLVEDAKAFVEQAKKDGRTFTGAEAVPYARLLGASGSRREALETLKAARAAEGVSDDVGTEIRSAFLDISLALVSKDELKGPDAEAIAKQAETFIEGARGEKAKNLVSAWNLRLGGLFNDLKRSDDAMRHFLVAVEENPGSAATVAKMLLDPLIEGAKSPEAIAAARKAGYAILATLGAIQDKALEKAQAAGDKALVEKIEGAKKSLAARRVPLELIGNDVPAWTVDHAFRGGAAPADYKGKVVLIDFWATWCPWCIKSFPGIRDLLKEYGDKGFAVVGVTASSPNVFDARYDLDEDMKAKAPADWKPKPALQLARDATAEAKAEHATKEKEVIQTFLGNHEVTWDVVMIDAAEPSAKYGLTGWPYGVLVDRHGKIRQLHAGAILRDNKEQMAEMRKVIEELLAEAP